MTPNKDPNKDPLNEPKPEKDTRGPVERIETVVHTISNNNSSGAIREACKELRNIANLLRHPDAETAKDIRTARAEESASEKKIEKTEAAAAEEAKKAEQAQPQAKHNR